MLSMFTFVYNSDAAIMMVAQCSCNHSQLNIRPVPNIQSSPEDLTQWTAFRKMSGIQRHRLIPRESGRVFGVSLFVLGAIYAENESMKTRLPWPRKKMTQECALVDNTGPPHTGIPPVYAIYQSIHLWTITKYNIRHKHDHFTIIYHYYTLIYS